MASLHSTTLASVAAAFVMAVSGNVMANETPTAIKGGEVVTASQAKALMDGGATVVDMRLANEFAEEHIKGAVNVPYKEKSEKAADFDASLDRFDVSKLPANKAAPFVAYCNGAKCWKSYKGSVASIADGHKKVYWLRGGLQEWKAAGLPTE